MEVFLLMRSNVDSTTDKQEYDKWMRIQATHPTHTLLHSLIVLVELEEGWR